MKMRRLILPIAAVMLSSCATDMSYDDLNGIGPIVVGNVTDMEGNPIEHIQVTLDWGPKTDKTIVFTSSKGIFKADAILADEGQTTLMLKFEDIDGEDTGGYYETAEETIILYEEEAEVTADQIRFDLDFRLNPATASESIPQS